MCLLSLAKRFMRINFSPDLAAIQEKTWTRTPASIDWEKLPSEQFYLMQNRYDPSTSYDSLDVCLNISHLPIFSGIPSGIQHSINSTTSVFCLAGSSSWSLNQVILLMTWLGCLCVFLTALIILSPLLHQSFAKKYLATPHAILVFYSILLICPCQFNVWSNYCK